MVDPRQVVAGFLTLSMFVMLGNMIKHDHFTPASEVVAASPPRDLLAFSFSSVHGVVWGDAGVFIVLWFWLSAAT